jgi:putative transposase
VITRVHLESRGTYGALRVHAELTMGKGITVGHNAVAMLMRRAGLQGLPGSRRPRSKHQTPTVGDLVERQFARTEPDQLWVTDIERHEALLNRAVMKGHRRRAVAAAWPKLGAA